MQNQSTVLQENWNFFSDREVLIKSTWANSFLRVCWFCLVFSFCLSWPATHNLLAGIYDVGQSLFRRESGWWTVTEHLKNKKIKKSMWQETQAVLWVDFHKCCHHGCGKITPCLISLWPHRCPAPYHIVPYHIKTRLKKMWHGHNLSQHNTFTTWTCTF